MKKKITAFLFAALLLTSSCGSTKPAADECCKQKTEVRSNEDPVMNLLASALIIFTIQLLVTK